MSGPAIRVGIADDGRRWVAEQDGRIVGGISLTDETAGIACLHRLHVEPDWRGRGIGAALLDACLGYARRSGFHVVMLAEDPKAEPARRLFRRCGFLLLEEGGDETWMLTLRMADR